MAYINYVKVSDWTKESVLDCLATSDSWVEKALVALYKRQTALEQQHGITRDKNTVGFQVADSEVFGEYARQLIAGKRLDRYQLAYCRRPWHRGRVAIPTIGKYRGQILEMIDTAILAKGKTL